MTTFLVSLAPVFTLVVMFSLFKQPSVERLFSSSRMSRILRFRFLGTIQFDFRTFPTVVEFVEFVGDGGDGDVGGGGDDGDWVVASVCGGGVGSFGFSK